MQPMAYLLKTEPSVYSFADLEREGETIWDGVSNPVAVKFLRGMKPGDELIIYHTGDEKTAVGTAKVLSVDASNPSLPGARTRPPRLRPTSSSPTRPSSARDASPSCPSPSRSTNGSSAIDLELKID